MNFLVLHTSAQYVLLPTLISFKMEAKYLLFLFKGTHCVTVEIVP